ncbi:MAG: S-layer homology domain-containing protein [Candidatus Gracilibacteria bacterium]|jgi:hypothetical protein
MKKMKLGLVAILIVALFAAQASASMFAKTEVDPMDALIPQDTLILAKFNLTNVSDSIKSVYNELLGGIQSQDDIAVLLQDIFDDQVAMGVMLNDSDSGIFIITNVTDEEYTEFETQITSDVSIETSTYFSRIGDYLVVADSEWMLQMISDTYSAGTGIANSDYYNQVRESFLDDDFMEFYMAMQSDFISQLGLSSEGESTMLDAIKAFGFSIENTDDGLRLKSYSVTDSAVLAELGIDYTNSVGTPDLYNFMPSDSPIFYTEGFNIKQSWDALVNTGEMDSYQSDIETEFQDAIGVDFNDGFMSLLENGVAFSIQDSGEFLPSSTVMIDVNGQENKAQLFLNGLVTYVWDLMKTADDVNVIDENTISVNNTDGDMTITKSENEMLGGDFTQFTIEFVQKETDNPYQIFLPVDALTYEISLGVTSDGILLLSTNKSIESDYGQGIDEFDLSEKVLSVVSYFSMDNIGVYVDRMLSDMIDANEDVDTSSFQDAKDSMDGFFGIFHDVYSESVSTNDYSTEDVIVDMDMDKLTDLWVEFLNATIGVQDGVDTYSNSQTTFEDVSGGEWYTDDVYYLKTEGVVTGYEDGSFAPSNDITRAEFTTLLVRALREKGYLTDVAASDSYESLFKLIDTDTYSFSFEDVSDYDWYADDLYIARENGIITGYEDGTFKPNEPITRAEAVQMIANCLDIVVIAENAGSYAIQEFPDVSGGQWYYDAVSEAQMRGIVSGTADGIFEPTRYINRAESAKIISQFMEVVEENRI